MTALYLRCRLARFARWGACGVLGTCLIALLAGGTGAAHAQSVVIGAGSTWTANDGRHDLGCADLTNHGILSLGTAPFHAVRHFSNTSFASATAATLDIGGNWSNTGTFAAGNSEIRLTDDCGAPDATIGGATTFPTLSIVTALGREIRFAAGATQTVEDALILRGQAGHLLVLRSTQDGTQAFIDLRPGATQSVQYVDVADHSATGQVIAPGPPAQFFSTDSGNTTRWFDALATPAPALSGLALLLVVTLLAVIARSRLRAQARPLR